MRNAIREWLRTVATKAQTIAARGDGAISTDAEELRALDAFEAFVFEGTANLRKSALKLRPFDEEFGLPTAARREGQ